MEKLLISNSPHIRSSATTKRIMIDVLIALLPAAIMGIVYFGLNALLVILISLISAVACEWIYKLIVRVPFKTILKEFDYTSAVTGLLLAMNMPSTVPWYLPIFGSAFAIIVVKMIFGGTGKNFVNPAIAGRVFLFISFSSAMTSGWAATSIANIYGSIPSSGATVLGGAILSGDLSLVPSNLDLLLGTGIAGCIGETCKLALLLGGVYLFVRKVIDWKPLIYIGVVGVMTVAIQGFDFNYFLPSILSGGLFLGAIFMATDYVTCPNTKLGSYIYYVLLGVLTAWLRLRNGMEVVSFVILLGNVCSPLIDRFVVPKPFGYEKPQKVKDKKKAEPTTEEVKTQKPKPEKKPGEKKVAVICVTVLTSIAVVCGLLISILNPVLYVEPTVDEITNAVTIEGEYTAKVLELDKELAKAIKGGKVELVAEIKTADKNYIGLKVKTNSDGQLGESSYAILIDSDTNKIEQACYISDGSTAGRDYKYGGSTLTFDEYLVEITGENMFVDKALPVKTGATKTIKAFNNAFVIASNYYYELYYKGGNE